MLSIFVFHYHQVNYVKYSDKYLIGCFVFVFLTLVEYGVVLLLKARQKNHEESQTLKGEKVRYIHLLFFRTKPSTVVDYWLFPWASVARQPCCLWRLKRLCFPTRSLSPKILTARLGVVKQSFLVSGNNIRRSIF